MRRTKAKPKADRAPPSGFPLTQLLADKRMSKRQLSRLSHIPLPMVNRLAKPGSNPTWTTILKLVEAMDIAIKFHGERRPT